MRSPAPKRWAGFGTATARPLPTNCPTSCRMTPARNPGRTHELADLVAEAAGGLSDRDHSVLELAYRHGLDGPDLADALGVSRATPTRSCTGCVRPSNVPSAHCWCLAAPHQPATGCRVGGDPRRQGRPVHVLMRKRIARHVESCATCDEERRRLVSPAALLGACRCSSRPVRSTTPTAVAPAA